MLGVGVAVSVVVGVAVQGVPVIVGVTLAVLVIVGSCVSVGSLVIVGVAVQAAWVVAFAAASNWVCFNLCLSLIYKNPVNTSPTIINHKNGPPQPRRFALTASALIGS